MKNKSSPRAAVCRDGAGDGRQAGQLRSCQGHSPRSRVEGTRAKRVGCFGGVFGVLDSAGCGYRGLLPVLSVPSLLFLSTARREGSSKRDGAEAVFFSTSSHFHGPNLGCLRGWHEEAPRVGGWSVRAGERTRAAFRGHLSESRLTRRCFATPTIHT